MKVSIITVSYNSEKTIAHTIESVLAQTYDDIEYWIIDGKSSDGTVALAESYCNAMEQKGIIYHILSEPDGGIYDAMNKGIRLATGDVIGIINSDDWYEPNAVGTAVHTFEKTGCDLMFADIRMYKADGSTFVKKHDCADFRHQETGIIRQRLSKRNCTKSIHFEIKAFMMIMAFFYKCKARNGKLSLWIRYLQIFIWAEPAIIKIWEQQ